MTEIELSVLHRQCLKAHIPDQLTLTLKTTTWYEQRNRKELTVNWRFTTDDARIKLHRLYPTINVCYTTSPYGYDSDASAACAAANRAIGTR